MELAFPRTSALNISLLPSSRQLVGLGCRLQDEATTLLVEWLGGAAERLKP